MKFLFKNKNITKFAFFSGADEKSPLNRGREEWREREGKRGVDRKCGENW